MLLYAFTAVTGKILTSTLLQRPHKFLTDDKLSQYTFVNNTFQESLKKYTFSIHNQQLLLDISGLMINLTSNIEYHLSSGHFLAAVHLQFV